MQRLRNNVHHFRLLLTLNQIYFYLISMAQIVGNSAIDVGKRGRRIVLGNRLGRRAILKGMDDQLQQHAGVADAARR